MIPSPNLTKVDDGKGTNIGFLRSLLLAFCFLLQFWQKSMKKEQTKVSWEVSFSPLDSFSNFDKNLWKRNKQRFMTTWSKLTRGQKSKKVLWPIFDFDWFYYFCSIFQLLTKKNPIKDIEIVYISPWKVLYWAKIPAESSKLDQTCLVSLG